MKRKSSVSALFFFPALLIVLSAGLTAHSSNLFRQFSTFKTVSGIVSDGSNLWLATSGGVVRYTLSTAAEKIYTDLSDLPDLNLTGVVRDRAGDIWFGSVEGYLVRLHPATETFTTYNALASAGWPITCMLFFKDNIFIGTPNGFSIFSIEKNFIQNVKQIGTFSSVDVSMLRSYNDTLALMTSDGFASCVVRDVPSTIFSDPSLWRCVAAPGALGIIHDHDTLKASSSIVLENGSTTWLFGAGYALLRNGTMAGSFPSPVTCLLPLDNGSIALGTFSSFCWYYDGGKNAYTQITADGPSESVIGGCALDRSGQLWYVPQDPALGFGYFDGTKWPKITHTTNSDVGSLGAGMLTARNTIMSTTKNDVWVSFYADGTKFFNRETGAWTSYLDPYGALPHVSFINPYPPPYNSSPLTRFAADTADWWTFVSGVCEDSLGNLWVANYQPYTNPILNIRRPRENTWRTLSYGDSTYNFLSKYTGPVASSEDKINGTEHIYLGYVHNEAQTGGGISVLSYRSSADPITAAITCVNSNSGHSFSISDIAVANDTLAWLACGDGIYRMTRSDPNTVTKITRITSSNNFNAVAAGYDGRAVFCKDMDLYSYKDGDTVLTQLTHTAKFGTSVNSIVLDKKNSVFWVASNKGLFRFDTGDSTAATAGHAIDVYPNPVSSRNLKSGNVVRFSGLDYSNPNVRIFDAGGALVARISGQNTKTMTWNGANPSGTTVIPGIYFYQASVGSGKYSKGRIFVIP